MIISILLFLLPQTFSLPTSRHDNTNTACNLLTSDHTAYDCLPDLSLESTTIASQKAHDIRGGDNREGFLTCPDGKNTIMYYEVTDWHLVKVCECWGKHQFYNGATKQCHCHPSFIPSYDNRGILSCHPRPTQLTPNQAQQQQTLKFISRKKKGSMRESLGPNDQAPMKGIDVERKGEEGLLCGWGQRGCKVGGEWACLDITSGLTTCGGCPGEPETVDCTAIPGVSSVQCVLGQCHIESCQSGFVLDGKNAGSPAEASCVFKPRQRFGARKQQ
ncbi:hypothetical protein C361_02454 [Cryptococcus neoformans Tu259-1]|uniref:Protein CPL1-like domain-containing protein n=1 Tax=Cryptococcus neoformans Tu259-1 TaxID=1230072 RepID=A0A854QFL7_CRYNE|nr:hypothetical protein C361_02454 [Cryptococcus neoformans var. grubii Tu259-1]OXG36237.1 hypothetical protein C360_02846 [Cryptococcus neoformans var. grubii Bt15]OXG43239.1 hypothetical protein C359_01633 [Cryptococcus neoformans var. grubii Bt120]OXG84096.1 hypothetical protein C350_02211 [Cryptococcus neoformans var. grubii MW-RSA36]OXL09372.1 hypothetical protein C348_02409 [Cryptococcus neoformans var. grubii Gb118]